MPWVEERLRFRWRAPAAAVRPPVLVMASPPPDVLQALCELYVKWYDGTGIFDSAGAVYRDSGTDLSAYSLVSNADLADLEAITDRLEPHQAAIRAYLRSVQP
jgi:hypothetical protein